MKNNFSFIDGYKFIIPFLIDVDLSVKQYKVFVNCDKKCFLYMSMKLNNKEKAFVYENKENAVPVYITFMGDVRINEGVYCFECGFTPCELVD